MYNAGNFPEDFPTIPIHFSTKAQAGGAVAPSSAFEAADFRIYKNGGETEKTSTNGLTIRSPHDSVVGAHTLVIDSSNDTGDAGFWEAGAIYSVLLSPDETVDGQTIAEWIATFTLSLSGNPRGEVVSDGSNAAASFEVAFSGGFGPEATDQPKNTFLTFLTGNCKGQTRKVTAYNTTTNFVTVNEAFSETPAAGDKFEWVNR